MYSSLTCCALKLIVITRSFLLTKGLRCLGIDFYCSLITGASALRRKEAMSDQMRQFICGEVDMCCQNLFKAGANLKAMGTKHA